MHGRPELRVLVEREDPEIHSGLGVLSYPIQAAIDIRWHFGDGDRALIVLHQAYLDARAQIEVTLKPNADANEGES